MFFEPLVVLIALVVLYQAIRRPVQRRLAIRDATRRPGETVLVIAGSLLGTALITGSLIVGDTLDSSIRSDAYTQLGPVDEIVQLPDPNDATALTDRLESLDDDRIDGVMTAVGVPASAATQGGAETRAEPEAQVIELDFDEASDFGGDPQLTGISGETPSGNSVAVTDDLAETLRVSEGDDLRVFIYGAEETFEIDRILPQRGLAGFWLQPGGRSFNIFVEPGTIDEAVAIGLPEGASPPVTSVLVSNRGGVEDSVGLTDEVEELIKEAGGNELRVDTAKENLLAAAEREGKSFQELFLGIGAFAVIAGILLLVNIFVMLADERKSQLGMLRAIGMKRADLIRAFVIEGSFYAFAASVFGALLGIGVGWGIVKIAAPIFGGFEDFGLDLVFSMEPASLVVGFSAGVVISFVTILVTSIRISRINIIAAIRDLPEQKFRITRLRNMIIGGVVAALMFAWFLVSLAGDDAWAGVLLGLPIALYFLLPMSSRLVGRRSAIIATSAAALAWGIFGNSITGGKFFEGGDIFSFVAQGILLTFSAVVLLSQVSDYFEKAFARFGGRNLSLRLGMSYPLAQRFRTGLTLGMYALVIFTMTFIAVLTQVFGGQVDQVVREASGGYDVVMTASSANPPSEQQVEGFDGVTDATALLSGFALYDAEGVEEEQPWGAIGISEEFLEIGPPDIENQKRAPGLEDDDAVWQAVMDDPQMAVVPDFFLVSGGGPEDEVVEPGDDFTMVDPLTGKTVTRTVAGVLTQDLTFSVYSSTESIRDVLGDRAAPATFFVGTDGGDAEARDVAATLQGELFRNGVEADTFRTIVEDFQSANLQFFRLMQAYLALGLVVGIAGLGVVMVRSVRERRREIGVLRAIGFVPGQIRSAFLTESGFTALEGILVGAALALVTASQLVESGEFGETAVFAIPWMDLLILCGAAFVASLLATAWPARQASTIPPAVALRISE